MATDFEGDFEMSDTSEYAGSLRSIRTLYDIARCYGTLNVKMGALERKLLVNMEDLYIQGYYEGSTLWLTNSSEFAGTHRKLSYGLEYGEDRSNFAFKKADLEAAFTDIHGAAEGSKRAFRIFCLVISEAARFHSVERRVRRLLDETLPKLTCTDLDFDWTSHKDQKDVAIKSRKAQKRALA